MLFAVQFLAEMRIVEAGIFAAGQFEDGAEVKRRFVCKPWTIEKADENSNGTPWFVLHKPNSGKLRFHLPSLPWPWCDA